MDNVIKIKGAKVHNLKNINVDIPKNKLVVFTGLSGSGKSSLAFDTIYAEGQRRYMESLSTYARQFLSIKEKTEVDKIEGLAPAIAIDQRAVTHNPRSTVGTMTEIYDFLRILYTNIGEPHCPKCGQKITAQSSSFIADKILELCEQTTILVLAPVIRDKRGQHRQILKKLYEAKYKQVRIDGYICSIEEAIEMDFNKEKKHNIEVIVDQYESVGGKIEKVDYNNIKLVKNNTGEFKKFKEKFNKIIKIALDLSNGLVIAYDIETQHDNMFSENLACMDCGVNLPKLEPGMFSFNSPHGACGACGGLGTRLEVDIDLVMPNKKLTIAEGAIRPWSRISGNGQANQIKLLAELANNYSFNINTPINKLNKEQLDIILYGEAESKINNYEGVAKNLLRRHSETNSSYVRAEIEKYMRVQECSQCKSMRLKPEILAITIGNKNISELSQMTFDKAIEFLKSIKIKGKRKEAVNSLIKEIILRLQLIVDVGLNYLTLDRSIVTLSGGEVQKIRLATQIGSNLTGVIYILDEPSIGLHERDNKKLINTLRQLQKMGNTVIVVEHDETMINSADWILDVGPGAGKNGGEIVALGKPSDIKKNKQSLTGKFLSGSKKIKIKKNINRGNGKYLEIIGAEAFNLKNINVKIPLGKFVCISGVSGSGKSTLMDNILSKALAQHFYKAKEIPGKYKKIKGLNYINKVVSIDQSPIGRTPRSNPATYTGVFTYIRELWAKQPEARIKGFDAGHFSFNVKGGRCEACQGDGEVKIEMHFLPDVYVECEECHGKRYNNEALEIYWHDKNIADVLAMTVEEALEFFIDEPQIVNKLKILNDVGLGYIQLGQPAPTLSGGEAQRVKLATELSRRATGRTLYILDEPTIGLHFDDINKLLDVLNRLVDKGNTVLVIEHNLDVLKSADWIIDLGPEGGTGGGEIVAQGTPKDIINNKRSWTGKYLKLVK